MTPPKPPKPPRRPKARAVGPLRLRVVRGPRQDGAWYWRAGRADGAGGEITVWTGWGTAAEAERAAADLVARGQAEQPRDKNAPTVVTVKDLIEYYMGSQEDRADLKPRTLLNQKGSARRAIKGAGHLAVNTLTRASLEMWRDQWLRGGGSTGTLRTDLTLLGAAVRWASEVSLITLTRLPSIRLQHRPCADRNFFTPTPAEMADVLAQLDTMTLMWPAVAMHLMIGTGARVGEVEGLTWARIDLQSRRVYFDGKTGPRMVPLAPPVVARLSEWRLASPERLWPVRCMAQQFRDYLARACEAAQVPLIPPHGLRRAAVDALYRSGVDIAAAAAVVGHSPKVALQHYRRVTAGDTAAAIERAGLGYLPTPSQSTVTGAKKKA